MAIPSNDTPKDVDLVQRTLAGSQEAFRDLVVRYQRPVLSLIRRMVKDQAIAEELAQEVFLKAFRALASYDQRRKFSNWLFKIAHNSAIDLLRRRRLPTVPLETTERDEPDLVAVVADSSVQDPESRAQNRDLAKAIEAAIGSLKPLYREVVVLRYQQGLAYEEITEVTGLPLGTVKTHLFRARKAMAQYLEQQGWRP